MTTFHSLVNWLVLGGVNYETPRQFTPWISEQKLIDLAQPAANQPTVIVTSQPQPHQQNFDSLEAFNGFVASWKGPGLAKTASKAVLGRGKASQPALMVIAEAPDADEDRQGNAFVGPANSIIVQMLKYANFSQDDVYLTYVSKWRPPGQRALASHELGFLSGLLHQEIGFVRPKAVLLLGESSLKAFLSDSDGAPAKIGAEFMQKKQYLDYNLPVIALQKGEILVKTPSMKKKSWLGLVNFAAAVGTKDLRS